MLLPSLKDGKRDSSKEDIFDQQSKHLQNLWETFNFTILKIFIIII